jgi:hypothetical protein
MRRRRALLIVAIASSVLVLVGCTQKSHVSAGLRGGDLVFIDCGDYLANELSVYATPLDKRWADAPHVWEANSPQTIGPRLVITYGSPPSGFSNTIGPEPFDPRNSKFEVAFKNSATDSTLPSEVAQFDGTKLVSGKWLDWDGNVVTKPCTGR